jgi:hypothetical protein
MVLLGVTVTDIKINYASRYSVVLTWHPHGDIRWTGLQTLVVQLTIRGESALKALSHLHAYWSIQVRRRETPSEPILLKSWIAIAAAW